ncbi:glycoside hydrolase family protein [Escherichia coli]|uniref:glycoside hydrolase family protein n=1 Tax=Escherichia coli TaxID=562 RepID=UPI003CC91851
MEQIVAHCESYSALTFQNHTDCPLTDFRGKTSIFSHPVYLFLRKFSLQDSRGGSKCFPSTFYKRINAGDRKGACEAIRWWIKDGGRDCRIRSNNCYGQVSRRDQESALACWDIDR